ncbi:hypothetical protein A2866_03140 [Candidatus Roizmanbacteria bacterium RIFCSPHIGHO2_01_FULL_39_8]|uniref:Uncharacterized protein n=3 Tax=Candidatus Roizmaniibacteriota TaxID=1752723 RepID=A0A1F7GGN2_9BACT|nr:MAG: hypothetical protein A2866_03140 [Candidatus Roizmanbacteria bacterium RIFCSPHIGHO2_01_FULL_39_8]OGK25329.1 MAG: hypothetical protein A3C28_00920 [Candidatus Roizmanbacteria bacterium RIFCSPHIGHO2_02_FULL_39_9]OGK37611.1 MAG: hypothetical protein A3F60_01780 [Candidatus Roizmanbacteria bacterium RIFCSPHIGHO2_12_FULL_39_8]
MYYPKARVLLKKALFFLPILLILPFIIIFDSLVYFITRPSCLTCGNLLEFLKTGSLSISLIGGVIGYKLKKNHGSNGS